MHAERLPSRNQSWGLPFCASARSAVPQPPRHSKRVSSPSPTRRGGSARQRPRQPCHGTRRIRRIGAAGRPRPARECFHRLRPQPRRPARRHLSAADRSSSRSTPSGGPPRFQTLTSFRPTRSRRCRDRAGRRGPARIPASRRPARLHQSADRPTLHPHRLPAEPRSSHAERPGRRGRRAGAAAVRVLRARGDQPADAHDRRGQTPPESVASPPGHRPDHVRPPQQPLRPRRRRRARLFRRSGLSRRWCPAISGSPKRRATANRCSSTTTARPGRRPMSGWPRSSCAASVRVRRRRNDGARAAAAPRARSGRPAR